MASREPQIMTPVVDMDDPQLLTHLLTLAGTEAGAADRLAHSLLDAHQSLEQVLSLPEVAALVSRSVAREGGE